MHYDMLWPEMGSRGAERKPSFGKRFADRDFGAQIYVSIWFTEILERAMGIETTSEPWELR
jgi:hypothetical protein